jgi:hypothetical protein
LQDSKTDDSVIQVAIASKEEWITLFCDATKGSRPIEHGISAFKLQMSFQMLYNLLVHVTFKTVLIRWGRWNQEISRKYCLMAEYHVKQVLAEMVMLKIRDGGPSGPHWKESGHIIEAYNFSVMHERQNLLENYRRAVELGSFSALDDIATKYATLVKSRLQGVRRRSKRPE